MLYVLVRVKQLYSLRSQKASTAVYTTAKPSYITYLFMRGILRLQVQPSSITPHHILCYRK
jgi:hypothetical protein